VCLVDWIGADYCSYTTDALYDLLVRFYLLFIDCVVQIYVYDDTGVGWGGVG